MKDNTLCLANNIYEQALKANTYWKLLNQYYININKYNDAMNFSPAFYNVIYTSLVESLFLNLSKIYDVNEDSITIRTLLTSLELITVNDLNDYVKSKYEFLNNKFQHQLKPNEECFFEEQVSEQKRVCKLRDIKYTHTMIDLNLEQLYELYVKKFNSLKHIRDNLIVQRNKIYVHNDKETNFEFDTIYQKKAINNIAIDKLIDYALDLSRYIIEILTGVLKADTYVNMNDWEATLMLVNIGHKYKMTHIDERRQRDDSLALWS